MFCIACGIRLKINFRELLVFTSGPLVEALLSSSAYPGMFTPMKWNGGIYADGGVINNYPTDKIHDVCDFHLGMYLSPIKPKPSHEFKNSFDLLDRVFEIYGSRTFEERITVPDISLMPEGIDNFSAFSVKNEQLEEAFKLGYEYSKQYFEQEGAEWLEEVKSATRKKTSWFGGNQ